MFNELIDFYIGIIHVVRTQNYSKNEHFLHFFTCAYHEVKKVVFWKNLRTY